MVWALRACMTVYVWMCKCTYQGTPVEIREQLCGTDFLLSSLCGFQALNSGHQACEASQSLWTLVSAFVCVAFVTLGSSAQSYRILTHSFCLWITACAISSAKCTHSIHEDHIYTYTEAYIKITGLMCTNTPQRRPTIIVDALWLAVIQNGFTYLKILLWRCIF